MAAPLEPQTKERVESWLREVELALQGVDVSTRAATLLALDSRIRRELSGGRPLSAILRDIGEPTQIGQAALDKSQAIHSRQASKSKSKAEYPRPHRSRLGVWLGAFMLFFAAVFIGGFFLLRSLFPLVDVDESTGEVRLLGGWINSKDFDGGFNFTVSDFDRGESEAARTEIGGQLSQSPLNRIEILAAGGELKMTVTDDPNTETVKYRCTVHSNQPMNERDLIIAAPEVIRMSLARADIRKVDCDLTLPQKAELQVRLANGTIDLRHPRQKVDARVENGRIRFLRAPDAVYEVDAQVTNGLLHGLEKVAADQQNPKGRANFEIKLRATNGQIRIE